MNLHEQARAEAEKRWPVGMYHVWDGNLPISSGMFGGIARDSFVGGFLAGHEAATRTRVVTTVTELDALRVGSVVLDSDADAWKRYGPHDWGCTEDLTITRWETSMVAAKCLPARVLYDPEEDR